MKMTRKNNSRGKKKALLLVLLLVICVVATASWLYATDQWPFTHSNTSSGDTSSELSTNTKTETNVNNAEKEAYVNQSKKPETAPKPVEPPTSPDTITLSAEKTGSDVVISTKLIGYAAGTCDVSISNSTKTYQNTADILYQPEYSTCAGFTVPYSQLGSGNWKITLTVTPDGGSSVVKIITAEIP